MFRRCLSAWTAILLVTLHTPFTKETWHSDCGDELRPPKSFKVGADSRDVIIDPKEVLRDSSCPNETDYELLEVIVYLSEEDVVPYWNKTAILLKIPQSSSLMNYSNGAEHELCMTIHYHRCTNNSGRYVEVFNEQRIHIKLRPVFIQLTVPSGGLILGKSFNLTCSVIGHVPNDINDVKVSYQSSSNGILDCTKPAFIDFNPYKSYIHSCTVVNQTALSNSGDYSCTAKIIDDIISCDDVYLTVEQDWQTITISAGASGFVVLLLVVIVILNLIIFCKIKRTRNEEVQVYVPPRGRAYRGGNENARLLEEQNNNYGIEAHRVNNYLNQHGGVENRREDEQRVEANLDANLGASGRQSPASSGGSVPENDVDLSDQGGYESAV